MHLWCDSYLTVKKIGPKFPGFFGEETLPPSLRSLLPCSLTHRTKQNKTFGGGETIKTSVDKQVPR